MFGFTRKTDYAMVALATLAGQGAAGDRPRSARWIADQNGLPLPLLMQVLKDLHRAGILRSTRGAGGGYHLADPPDRIGLVRVIEAIEGPLRVTVCCEDESDVEPCTACHLERRCPITTAMRRVNDVIVEFLGRITIDQLIESNQGTGELLEELGVGKGLTSRPTTPVALRKDMP